MSDQTIIAFVLDNPNEAADELAQLRAKNVELRAALQAYVDEAETHLMKGQPGSPFAMRLAAGRAALKAEPSATKAVSIFLPADVALNVLIELGLHARRMSESAAAADLTPLCRETRQKFSEEAAAALAAYQAAYRAAQGYK